MKVSLKDIKELREATGAGVADCREALEEAKGNGDKAMLVLQKKGLERAAKKEGRQVKAGHVFSYIHHNGRVGVLVSLACETDFVAKTDDFQALGKELCLHIAASQPETVEDLLDQEYVRDASQKVSQLIKGVIGKLGENIQVIDFKIAKV
ncbi:MAG: translation elongation factor Ts [bacterium]|nr:translation elongation factor Ts [bacterium]